MNPEFPTDPRKALEASLTALLLGELKDDQARFLNQTIAGDPELARTFESLKHTIQLVREAEADPDTQPSVERTAPKLSDQRRSELLQKFKVVQPSEFRETSAGKHSWLVPAAAAGVLLMTVAVALLPTLSGSKSQSMAQRSASDTEWLEARRKSGVANGTIAASVPRTQLFDSATSGSTYRLVTKNEQLARNYPFSPDGRTLTLSHNNSQNNIFLPAESSPESLALRANLGGAEKRDWQYEAKSPVVTDWDTPSAKSLSSFAQSSGIAGRGSGGDVASSPLNSPAQVPLLGDLPVVGGMFGAGLFTTNAQVVAGGLNEVVIPKLDDAPALASSDQKPEPGQKDGGTPHTLPEAAFRARYLNEQAANAKDQTQLTGSTQIEPQQSASANDPLYYNGGPFAGYSMIQPQAPGQTVQSALPAMGSEGRPKESPTQAGERAKSENKLALALPPLEQELGKTVTRELDRKMQLAELDKAKKEDNLERLNENIPGANGTADSLKTEESRRSKKLLALRVRNAGNGEQEDVAAPKAGVPGPVPTPEVETANNRFSTFSLNVSDVSFKLAAASLENGVMPEPASIRSEEFINAFDYRDPEPTGDSPVGFAWERAQYPFAQNRDVLRFSIKTAAGGRAQGQPLNIVLLLDNSGSMERADRVSIIHEALRVLATQLTPSDIFSVVTFARTARLWVDGVPGTQAGIVADELSGLTPQGGTNLEEAMNLAYQTALKHYVANGINRVVLLTDGAANLGDTNPEVLKSKVEMNRKQGIALDCFGIGWEGYNDDLLEVLTRHGDGRYGFLNTPEQAATEFAGKLAGALHVAASDVKVQVEFNTNRVISYRQIGYAHHQLTKEQFRDNTVDAAEIGAAESGNALYLMETNPQGEGPLAFVRVRYKVPGTPDFQEHEWTVPFAGTAIPLDQATPALRLATVAASFSEWLAASPYAGEVNCDRLLGFLNGVPSVYGADQRPSKLEWMIRQAKALSGK